MVSAQFNPGYVSKKSAAKIPGITTINEAMDGIFIDRGATKEERIAVTIDLTNR